MDNPVMRGEYNEFAKRIAEEDARQNRRIAELEQTVKQINALTIAINDLANSIDGMAKEQKRQGDKLESFEEVPKKNWDTFKYGVIGALASAIPSAFISIVFNMKM